MKAVYREVISLSDSLFYKLRFQHIYHVFDCCRCLSFKGQFDVLNSNK